MSTTLDAPPLTPERHLRIRWSNVLLDLAPMLVVAAMCVGMAVDSYLGARGSEDRLAESSSRLHEVRTTSALWDLRYSRFDEPALFPVSGTEFSTESNAVTAGVPFELIDRTRVLCTVTMDSVEVSLNDDTEATCQPDPAHLP